MPAAHSALTSNQILASLPVVPLADACEESLALYRPLAFFRNFDIKGPGDRLLIYMMLYTQECIAKLAKVSPTKIEGHRLLQTHAVSNFPLPGDSNFPLNSIFERPSRSEAGNNVISHLDQLKTYLTQLRQEMSTRLVERAYENDRPSKWWTCFSKRKFMGIPGVGTQ